MRRAQTYVGVEFARVLCKMGQCCSDNQASQTVTDEAKLCKTTSRAKTQNVLSDLGCKAFTHLKNVTFSLVLIRSRKQDDTVRVEKRNLISKQTHIAVVPLESVTHHKKMDPNSAATSARLLVDIERL
jgi:hypothetical protein